MLKLSKNFPSLRIVVVKISRVQIYKNKKYMGRHSRSRSRSRKTDYAEKIPLSYLDSPCLMGSTCIQIYF